VHLRLHVSRVDAEREFTLALLDASVGNHSSVICEVGAWFKLTWIEDPLYRAIAESVFALVKDNKPVTSGCVARCLVGKKKRFNVSYLEIGELIFQRFGWYHLAYLARCVYDGYRRVHVGAELASGAEGLESGGDVDEVLGALNEMPTKYEPIRFDRSTRVKDAVQEIIAEMDGKQTSHTLMGINAIDSITGGFAKGSLVVFAAGTSCGKSVLLGQAAVKVALDQKNVCFFATEMTERELVVRWAAHLAHAPQTDRARYIEGLNRITQMTDRDGLLQMFIGGRHVDQICREVEAYKASHNLGLVVVDYLQLYRGGNKHDQRERQVADVTGKLKLLAVECNVPVLTASQINRASQGTPKLSHLRESGAIEQDANVVLLLDPDDRHKPATKVSIVVAKNRQGRTDGCRVWWDKRTYTMRDLDEHDPPDKAKDS
jgi:archaellum biogenesis ATPase FlaH